MGVKTIREWYRIGHIVQRVDNRICIGSPYIHNIIVISMDGKIVMADDYYRNNADLQRYIEELRQDEKSGFLRELISAQDTFGPLTPVYTHEDGRVIRKQCEVFGWPHTTTDGMIMYENSHFLSRTDAVRHMMEDTRLGVKYTAKSFYEDGIDAVKIMTRRFTYLAIAVWKYVLARVTR